MQVQGPIDLIKTCLAIIGGRYCMSNISFDRYKPVLERNLTINVPTAKKLYLKGQAVFRILLNEDIYAVGECIGFADQSEDFLENILNQVSKGRYSGGGRS